MSTLQLFVYFIEGIFCSLIKFNLKDLSMKCADGLYHRIVYVSGGVRAIGS